MARCRWVGLQVRHAVDGGGVHPQRGLFEAVGQGFERELFLRLEMGVQGAVGESGFLADLRNADAIDPAFPDQFARCAYQ
jgi:hypothetical protein